MTVSVFGNPDLPADAMPVCLIPALQKRFPNILFAHQDPNELGEAPDNPWYIIDTVKGLSDVQLITDLSRIKVQSRVSMHDYDLSMHLTLLKKIHPDLEVKIIGVPPNMQQDHAAAKIATLVAKFISN